MEAYEQSLILQPDSNAKEGVDGQSKRRPCAVCSVKDPSDTGEAAALHRQVEDLQDALAQATRGMAAMAAGQKSGSAAPPDAAPAITPVPDASSTLPPPTGCSTLHQGMVAEVAKPC